MVERIRTLLQARQLSPTQFADAIGVARPIVSHILSGRNKPSLEVVQKIIGAFPDLSLPWLLSGTGPMVAFSAPVAEATPGKPATPVPAIPEAQEMPLKRARPAVAAAVPAPASAPVPPVQPEAQTLPAQPPVRPAVVPAAEPAPQPEPLLPPLAAAPAAVLPRGPVDPTSSDKSFLAFAEPGKKIRRIVIFYQDGTFTDYQPE